MVKNSIKENMMNSLLFMIIPLIIKLIMILLLLITGVIYNSVILKMNITSLINIKLITKNMWQIINIVSILFSLIIINFIFKERKIKLLKYCLFQRSKGKYILACMCMGISFNILVNQFLNNIYTSNFNIMGTYYDNSLSFYNDMSIGLFFLSFCILTPIFEEIIFRGIIQNQLENGLGIAISIFTQTLLFALYHFNIIQVLYTFALGIILTIIVKITKSIWTSIVLHICFNSANLLSRYLLYIDIINIHWNTVLCVALIFSILFILYMGIRFYKENKVKSR